MFYGTSKSTGPWMMSLRLSQEPRCPGCAEFLQPVVVEFSDGWAWCQICVAQKLPNEVHLAWVMQLHEVHECSTIVSGLRFYTPDATKGEALTAYEWYERSKGGPDPPTVPDSPDGLYLLTPAGEKAIADRPVIDERAWNARCLAQRKLIAERGYHTNSDGNCE